MESLTNEQLCILAQTGDEGAVSRLIKINHRFIHQVIQWSREAPPCHITMAGLHQPLREPDLHLSMYPALLSLDQH